ncbi:MAG: hypothetical protein H6721_00240 [Sandaracinus sp.]|nr:hypothetical protein [Sandaracinus sp.]MCB9630571.1 hypothetical protein [Sandaracinus sp.]
MWIALATALVSFVLFATFSGWTARALGVRVGRVVLFAGPRVASFHALGLPFELRALPLASHVIVATGEPTEPTNRRPDVELDPPRLPWRVRVVWMLVPWAVLFAPTLAVLGTDAFVELLLGAIQFFAGLAFWSEGPAQAQAVLALFASGAGLRIAALTVVKLTSLNLLVMPILTGGLLWPRPPPWWSLVVTWVVLATFVGWVVSFVTAM